MPAALLKAAMLENYSINSQGPHYPCYVTCHVIPTPDWRLSRRMSGTQWPLMSGGREQFLRSLSLSSLCRSFLTPEPCEAPLQLQCRCFLVNSSSSRLFRPRSEASNGPNIAGILTMCCYSPSSNHNLPLTVATYSLSVTLCERCSLCDVQRTTELSVTTLGRLRSLRYT